MKKIGISLIIMGILIPLFSFSKEKVFEVRNTYHIKEILENNNYYMILEIPKINLKREIHPKDSKENNVNKNIYLHPGSNDNNIILASHSGYGTHAYFKNLDKLKINDEVILYYNGTKSIYEISDIEEQLKTGALYLKENNNKMITLITCSKNNSKTQKIYYGKLKNG